MIAYVPNDRSVIRLPEWLVLQTRQEAEVLCTKRLSALQWIVTHRGRWIRPRRRLRLVS